MKCIFILINLIITNYAVAQKGNAEQKEAIQKLRWIIGNWTGISVVNINNQKKITHIKEVVQTGLDRTILLITVRATDADSNTNKQSLAYQSFSVISYDPANKKYRWTSWRTSGQDYEEQPFTIGDNSFEYITHEDGKEVRYKAALNSKSEFLETGEYSKNSSAWEEFITMKLIKNKR